MRKKSSAEPSVAGERFVSPALLSPPVTDAQPRSLPSTFLLVDDPQRAGIPDEQMPVAKHTKGASVHVSEVEKIVEIVVAHGVEDGEELEDQVSNHLGGRTEEVPQGPGAGTDHQPSTGAQVPWEGPSLHIRKDLPGRVGMGYCSCPLAIAPCQWTHLPPRGLSNPWLASSSSAGIAFCFLKQPAILPQPSLPQQPGKVLLHPGVPVLNLVFQDLFYEGN